MEITTGVLVAVGVLMCTFALLILRAISSCSYWLHEIFRLLARNEFSHAAKSPTLAGKRGGTQQTHESKAPQAKHE